MTGPDPIAAAAVEEGVERRDIAERFHTGGWEFTPEVAEVFPEHVRASVPFYDAVQDLVAEVADWTLPAGGVFADLGSSTGATLDAIIERHGDRGFTSHLYDESKPMMERAKALLSSRAGGRVYYNTTRLQDGLAHEGADLTTVLFVLQFLSAADRVKVLEDARRCAGPDGALIVAEKVRPTDPRWAEIANDRSHDWKAAHGISDEAIRAKARALRGVLIPHPVDRLRAMIADAGWEPPETLFAWHSWVILGAFNRR